MSAIPLLALNDGNRIPAIGFGTWPLDDAAAEQAVKTALADGYRLIDTASRYGNEKGVGKAISESGIPRAEIFLTTKLRGLDHGFDNTLRAFDESAKRLGVDYVDLYLIHWPLPAKNLYVETWKAFIELRRQGRVRSIGLSNFQPPHIQLLMEETGAVPAVNQIELHVDFAQSDIHTFGRLYSILTEAWSPLGRGSMIEDEVVGGIAKKHGRTPAQIMLRWCVQIGVVPIPKSANPARIAANIDVFDFALDADDMDALAKLDGDHRTGGDPDTYVEE